MQEFSFRLSLMAALLVFGVSGAPAAAPIIGEAAIDLVSAVAVPPGSLAVGVELTFGPAPNGTLVDTTGAFALLTGGDLEITLDNFVSSVGETVRFTGTAGTFVGEITGVNLFALGSQRVLSVFATGAYSPGGPLAAFDPSVMLFTFSADQTADAPDSPIGASATIFANGIPIRVPEPVALAIFGLGLAAMAGAARRRPPGRLQM